MFCSMSVLFLSVLPAAQPPSQREGLTLKARVLVAVEGGPVILKVTLTNHGKATRHFHQVNFFSNVSLVVPRTWRFGPRGRFFSGVQEGIRELGPGQEWSETICLHHEYRNISSGEVRLKVTWDIVDADKPSRVVPHPSTTVRLLIQKANKASLVPLREQLNKEIDRFSTIKDDMQRTLAYKRVLDYLYYTHHKELVPVAFRLFKDPERFYLKARLIDVIYAAHEVPGDAHALFLNYVLQANPTEAGYIFDYWQHVRYRASVFRRAVCLVRPADVFQGLLGIALHPRAWSHLKYLIDEFKVQRLLLPHADVHRLLHAPNVWVRVLTYATFPTACDRAWVAALMKQLRQRITPPPAAVFRGLLAQLDSPRFAVRERAAAELLRLGDTVAPALGEALKQRLSLELSRRIESLLAEIARERPDPLRSHTLTHLAWLGTPEALAVLQTLAKGMPQARLTKEAVTALEQAKEHRKNGTGALR